MYTVSNFGVIYLIFRLTTTGKKGRYRIDWTVGALALELQKTSWSLSLSIIINFDAFSVERRRKSYQVSCCSSYRVQLSCFRFFSPFLFLLLSNSLIDVFLLYFVSVELRSDEIILLELFETFEKISNASSVPNTI